MDSLEWSKTFIVLGVSRYVLRDVCGYSVDTINALSDDDLYRIADTLSQCYSSNVFLQRLKTITNDILYEKAKQEIQLCDSCDTWVATHEVLVGQTLYHVCDKPKCQDAIEALKGKQDG